MKNFNDKKTKDDSVKMTMDRRAFLSKTAQGLAGIAAASLIGEKTFSMPYIRNNAIADKIFVLGIDGMDPVLLKRFVQQGEMPTFQKLMQKGYFGPLGTTTPPQSPVAWSSFITGCNPGGHGIFDFIHRDPSTFIPYLSTSRSYDAEKELKIGNWSIPLKGGKVELLRRGPVFWDTLEENDIFTSFFKIPANFPVVPSKSKMISGMGTPDLLGTYGTFTFFTDVNIPDAESFTGGRVVPVQLKDHTTRCTLEGPANSYRTDKQNTQIDFTVHRDPVKSVVKINIQGQELVLNQGEWSDWLPVKFELMPLFASVQGIIRLYVQEVHPHFRLYATPINIDPQDANLPICSPAGYSKDLTDAIGRFYTQGFPEDTKALTHGIFSNEEFLNQSHIVLEERLNAFDHTLQQFNEGLYFFYFSSIDQNTHMLWRNMDPTHPLYEQNASKEVKEAVYGFYRSMDNVLKQTLSKMDNRSKLIILSDHGFAPFSREFHLSTWLVEKGFTVLTDPSKMHESQYYDYVDWSRTKAFALGLNSVYINLRGREVEGSVAYGNMNQIKRELIEELQKARDPLNGRRIVTRAFDSQTHFSGPYTKTAPDIIVGYNSGYRISDEAVLGKFPKGVVGFRKDKWSADHCMDPKLVPGTLITDFEVTKQKPAIWDLAPTILKGFGLDVPHEMDGESVFS